MEGKYSRRYEENKVQTKEKNEGISRTIYVSVAGVVESGLMGRWQVGWPFLEEVVSTKDGGIAAQIMDRARV